jgi:hypothetical protein
MITDFRRLLEALAAENVRFVVIGALALTAHGGSRVTRDLDVCYDRAPENLERLARALGPLHPRLRGAPPELPFVFDALTLKSGLNFTLTTDAGDVDVLGEVTGLGLYAECIKGAKNVALYGARVDVLALDLLERAKRAAGRAKDLLDLAEIAALRKKLGV